MEEQEQEHSIFMDIIKEQIRSGRVKLEELRDMNLSSNDMIVLMMERGNINGGLEPNQIEKTLKEFGLSKEDIEKFLEPEHLQENVNGSGLSIEDLATLIKATGKIEKYLTPEYCKVADFAGGDLIMLMMASGDLDKYLFPWQQQAIDKTKTGNEKINIYNELLREENINIANVIYATGDIEKYLTPEYVKELPCEDIAELIKATGNAEKYLTPEYVQSFGLGLNEIVILVKEIDNIDKYLFPWQKQEVNKAKTEDGKKVIYDRILSEGQIDISNLIYATGNIDKYLTLENVKAYGLLSKDIVMLMRATGDIETHLTPENVGGDSE